MDKPKTSSVKLREDPAYNQHHITTNGEISSHDVH